VRYYQKAGIFTRRGWARRAPPPESHKQAKVWPTPP